MTTSITQEQFERNRSAFEGGLAGLLTPDEARARGIETLSPTHTEPIGLICGGISPRFKDIMIITHPTDLEDCREEAMKKSEPERRRIWKEVLRNLLRYTDEELDRHREQSTQEWKDWCDDVAIFYAYNNLIFGKGVPAITNLLPEQFAEADRQNRPRGHSHHDIDLLHAEMRIN
jgi:hypothetical protein